MNRRHTACYRRVGLSDIILALAGQRRALRNPVGNLKGIKELDNACLILGFHRRRLQTLSMNELAELIDRRGEELSRSP